MACPYFRPLMARAGFGDSRSAMLPLGDSWMGSCCADPLQPWQPGEALLHPLCNLGYARGICSRFPAAGGPDAIRFTISRDDAVTLRIHYSAERDHHPFAHGAFEYSREYSRAAPAQIEVSSDGAARAETLLRQAEAYARSYLTRKHGANRKP